MNVRLRFFATAREAAGCSNDVVEIDEGASLAAVLDAACARYGTDFAAVLATAGVWVNGEDPPEGRAATVHDGDEVAVLPPVSGGACPPRRGGGCRVGPLFRPPEG